jgi:(heptosyl)LPS beta-1,4-glucosyltransferase
MNLIPVTAVIITLNEERKIATCLKSLLWTDEILIVDAHSRDRTREICLDPTQPWSSKVTFLEKEWPGFKDQRNFALAQAKNDWILSIDADEECSPELSTRLQSQLNQKQGPDKTAYKVRRQEFFMGKLILHGMWNPSYQDRFFNKKGVKYINEVHEYPLFPQAPGEIHEPLLHKTDLTIERYIDKLNKYTTIEAQDRYDQGQRTNLFRLIMAFPTHFLKSLLYYGAYKDGIHGVIISLLEGASRVTRQIKIWQIMETKKNKKEARQQEEAITNLSVGALKIPAAGRPPQKDL